MTELSEFQIAELPCPKCNYVVSEFVTHLVNDSRMICRRCHHAFQASEERILSYLGTGNLSDSAS